MAGPSPLEVGAPINYFDMVSNTVEPGSVVEVTGDNEYSVQVQNPDDSVRYEQNVGQRIRGVAKADHYIEPREYVGFEPPVVDEGEPISP